MNYSKSSKEKLQNGGGGAPKLNPLAGGGYCRREEPFLFEGWPNRDGL